MLGTSRVLVQNEPTDIENRPRAIAQDRNSTCLSEDANSCPVLETKLKARAVYIHLAHEALDQQERIHPNGQIDATGVRVILVSSLKAMVAEGQISAEINEEVSRLMDRHLARGKDEGENGVCCGYDLEVNEQWNH